jgi:hypothetical protein
MIRGALNGWVAERICLAYIQSALIRAIRDE